VGGIRGWYFPYNQAFGGGFFRFVIFLITARITNMGEGEGDDLASIRRISQNFLIASDGGMPYPSNTVPSANISAAFRGCFVPAWLAPAEADALIATLLVLLVDLTPLLCSGQIAVALEEMGLGCQELLAFMLT
jgi:hypothetical protein